MGIFYLISVISLIIIFLLIKKKEEKLNIIFWIFLSFTLILCYNVFECYILSLLKIKCYLITLGVVNIVFTILGLALIIRKRQIQKYYFKWQDIVVMIMLLVLVIMISYQRYNFPMEIKFESSDAATHYIAAKQFYKNKTLLSNAEIEDRLCGFETFMPSSYVNTGILFDIASIFISESDFYCVYIVFDIIVLYLCAMLFYLIITQNTNNTFMSIAGLIFTMLYMLAYPLNSMLFGFSYLSTGLLAIEGLIAIGPMLKRDEMKYQYILPMGFLLTFMIFFSYYLFMPVIYTALGIYLLLDIIKNRKEIKILSKSNILLLTIILIIPTVLGFCYLILPGLISNEADVASAINSEGYIYRNLYSNFILILPLALYYVIDTIKCKKNDFVNYATILFGIFILVMLVGVLIGKVSTYYYFKIYFAFWIFVGVASFKAIEKFYSNNNIRTFVYAYLMLIISIHIYSAVNIDSKLQNRNVYINLDPSVNLITHIYSYNKNYINNTMPTYTKEQKEILKYCEKNVFSKSDSVAVCAKNLQQRWIYAIYGIADVEQMRDFALIEKKFDIESWIKGDKQYYLYLNNGEDVEFNETSTKYKICFKNVGGVILKKK